MGEAYMRIGNGTNNGTAGNKKGYIQLYGQNTGRAQLEYENSASNVVQTFPAKTGKLSVYTTLYYNASGTTGTVTLSESAANYKFLDIYFGKGTTTMKFTRVYSPNGQSALLSFFMRADNNFQFLTKRLAISGKNITSSQYGGINVTLNSTTVGTFTSNELAIFRVDGWA